MPSSAVRIRPKPGAGTHGVGQWREISIAEHWSSVLNCCCGGSLSSARREMAAIRALRIVRGGDWNITSFVLGAICWTPMTFDGCCGVHSSKSRAELRFVVWLATAARVGDSCVAMFALAVRPRPMSVHTHKIDSGRGRSVGAHQSAKVKSAKGTV